jgi:hypothetical protein
MLPFGVGAINFLAMEISFQFRMHEVRKTFADAELIRVVTILKLIRFRELPFAIAGYRASPRKMHFHGAAIRSAKCLVITANHAGFALFFVFFACETVADVGHVVRLPRDLSGTVFDRRACIHGHLAVFHPRVAMYIGLGLHFFASFHSHSIVPECASRDVLALVDFINGFCARRDA